MLHQDPKKLPLFRSGEFSVQLEKMISEAYTKDSIESLPSEERQEKLSELETILNAKLKGCKDLKGWQDRLYSLIEELNGLGFFLYQVKVPDTFPGGVTGKAREGLPMSISTSLIVVVQGNASSSRKLTAFTYEEFKVKY